MGRRALRWVAFGSMAIYLAVAVTLALRQTFLRLRWVVASAGLPPEAVRRGVFGEPYVAAIEGIRRAIPAGEPYLISEQREYSLAWVRFDLLPRRAIDVRARGWRPQNCLQAQVRWLVVATGQNRPPLLFALPAGVPPGCPPAPWTGLSR